MVDLGPSSWFTSRREKRLWQGALLVTGAIFSTLWLASIASSWLYHQSLSAALFLAAMVLVGLAILAQGLRVRPELELGVALGLSVVFLMVFVRLSIPERSHLIEYGVLAVLVFEALSERAAHGKKVPFLPVVAILLASLVGLIDELLQLFMPSRHFDRNDILFNVLASLMTVLAMVVLRFARRLASKRREQRGPPEAGHSVCPNA